MYIYNYIYFWKKHRSKNATWHTWTLAACRVLVRRSYPLCSVVWRSQSWCGQLEEEHECRKVPDPQDVDTIKNKVIKAWIHGSKIWLWQVFFATLCLCTSKCIVTIRYLYYHILSYVQWSKDAMKGFNYDPPSLLKTCDLLCVAIGGLV